MARKSSDVLKAIRAAPPVCGKTGASLRTHGGGDLSEEQVCMPKASRAETEATGTQPVTSSGSQSHCSVVMGPRDQCYV